MVSKKLTFLIHDSSACTDHPTEDQIKIFLRKTLIEQKESPDWIDALILKNNGSSLLVSFIHPYFLSWFQQEKKIFFETIIRQKFSVTNFLYLNCIDNIDLSRDKHIVHNRSAFKKIFSINKSRKNRNIFIDYFYNEKNKFQIELVSQAINIFNTNLPVLLLCGKNGTGKTHLLNIIHESIKAKNNRIEPNFYSGDNFYEKIKSNNIFSFTCNNPFLIIDDIQFMIGDISAQNILIKFIDEFESKYLNNTYKKSIFGRIILTFSGQQTEINKLNDRLRIRLANCIITELQEPDLDVRLRYLEAMNKQKSLGLHRQQLVLLARLTNSIPSVIGTIRKIEFFLNTYGHSPNQQEMANIVGTKNIGKPVNWRGIIANVAESMKLKIEEIMGNGRKPDVVLARQVSMYLCRQKLGLSYPEIGKLFNGKDHSTVMHAIKRINKLLITDKDMHKIVTELENYKY